MRKTIILPAAIAFAIAAAMGLAACSPKAQNETSEAADTVAADANATMQEATNDTQAATDNAMGAAEASMDNAGAALDNAASAGKHQTGQTLKDAGNAIEE
ncbi:MAG: hypothetical protein M3R41_06710 [Pseudomonadota bacterium]|nr:hypothetical protein [Pseudomonadota bacterium]